MVTGNYNRVLLIGDNQVTGSIAVDLLKAGFEVLLHTNLRKEIEEIISGHVRDMKTYEDITPDISRLQYVETYAKEVHIAIAVTAEDAGQKNALLKMLDAQLHKEVVIAVNTESFLLSDLTKGTISPERILGLNWAAPVHTTRFLEIITDERTCTQKATLLKTIGEVRWQKDPYVVQCGYSIRARLMAAITREAFFLVNNGYASVEDIDRANRNDAGYYLPFAGNCRYMDLMGTYAYGLVMKDLNRELSKAAAVPDFFDTLVEQGKLGLETGGGFYSYDEETAAAWREKAAKFSYEIKRIIAKYPFNYLNGNVTDQKLSTAKVSE